MGRRGRRQRRGVGRPPRLKQEETPRRAWQQLRPRPRSLGYWLRRPEPSIAVGALFTVGSLLQAWLGDDTEAVILAVVMGLFTVFVWWARDICRHNAERWRLRRPDAF